MYMKFVFHEEYKDLIVEAKELGRSLVGKSILMSPDFQEALVLTRNSGSFIGKEEFPGGSINKDESVYDGSKRELQEETGIVKVDPHYILNYVDYETPKGELVRQLNFIHIMNKI